MGEEYLWQSKDWQGALTAAASVAGDRLEQVVRQQAQALSAVTATLPSGIAAEAHARSLPTRGPLLVQPAA